MISKAAASRVSNVSQMGAPVIASRNSPTSLLVARARNLTLAGYIRRRGRK